MISDIAQTQGHIYFSVLNRKCQHHLHNLIFKSNNIYSHSMRLKVYFQMFLDVIDHCETVLNVNTGVVLYTHLIDG